VNVIRKVKLLRSEAAAKASLNRAKCSVWHSDVKRDDLFLARMKPG
jgi:hypothetical protein